MIKGNSMDDLLERLRRDILSNRCGCQLLREAADAIERKDITIAAMAVEMSQLRVWIENLRHEIQHGDEKD